MQIHIVKVIRKISFRNSRDIRCDNTNRYAWIKRYKENGIKGLETRPGQSRKPIMDCSDEELVRKAIEEDRQSVSKAREAWEKASGKKASDITFKRFLGALVQDISE